MKKQNVGAPLQIGQRGYLSWNPEDAVLLLD